MDNEIKELLLNMQEEMKVINHKLDKNSEEMKVINHKLDKHSEELKKNSEEIKVINYKLDRNSEKIGDLDLRLRNAENNIRKDIRKLSEDNETIIEVLKQHDFLPR